VQSRRDLVREGSIVPARAQFLHELELHLSISHFGLPISFSELPIAERPEAIFPVK